MSKIKDIIYCEINVKKMWRFIVDVFWLLHLIGFIYCIWNLIIMALEGKKLFIIGFIS